MCNDIRFFFLACAGELCRVIGEHHGNKNNSQLLGIKVKLVREVYDCVGLESQKRQAEPRWFIASHLPGNVVLEQARNL